jgi:hypothetical protein
LVSLFVFLSPFNCVYVVCPLAQDIALLTYFYVASVMCLQTLTAVIRSAWRYFYPRLAAVTFSALTYVASQATCVLLTSWMSVKVCIRFSYCSTGASIHVSVLYFLVGSYNRPVDHEPLDVQLAPAPPTQEEISPPGVPKAKAHAPFVPVYHNGV